MESNPTVVVNWNTPAGRLLDRLALTLPALPARTILVFGSAVLQMTLEPAFLSRDVDIVGDEEGIIRDRSVKIVAQEERLDLAFQVCDALTFRTAQGWESRARREVRVGGHTFVFPHPWDILVSKIGRLEEKDLEAFRLVIRKTGGPTAEELQRHLQLAVDLFRPNFDEERGSDYLTQTRALWRILFDADLDVRAAIIRPALARRQAQYDADAGDPAWKDRLRGLGGG